MANESEIETLVTTTIKWGGHLDVWVNNAAVFQFGSATEASSAGQTFELPTQCIESQYCAESCWDLCLPTKQELHVSCLVDLKECLKRACHAQFRCGQIPCLALCFQLTCPFTAGPF